MTLKAGQKCTAIRRILVPAAQVRAAADAIRSQLEQITIGDPANASVGMGPLVNMTQRAAVDEGIRGLAAGSEIVYQAKPLRVIDADLGSGAFAGPTLLRVENGTRSQTANEIEVFGPVATLIPYADKQTLSRLRSGRGSLAASVFSADTVFLEEAAIALGPSHGRVLLVDPRSEILIRARDRDAVLHSRRSRPGRRRRGARAFEVCGSIIKELPCRAHTDNRRNHPPWRNSGNVEEVTQRARTQSRHPAPRRHTRWRGQTRRRGGEVLVPLHRRS